MAPPPVQIARNDDILRLPGMELLGFYDEPYQIQVSRPTVPSRARQILRTTHPSPVAASPSTRVSTLWETTELDESALEWWKPQVIARRKLGGRRLRASSTLISLGLVVVVALVAWSVLQRPGQRAEESRLAIQATAGALQDSLDPLRSLALAIGAPESPDLVSATATGLEAEGDARSLFTEAGELPEGGDLSREAAVAAASSVLDATARLNRLVAYRLTAESVLVGPNLPSSPSVDQLPDVTAAVADWRADVTSSVDELPREVLPENRAALEGWAAGLETWQQTYLDAVREGDVEAVAAAGADLRTSIERLIDGLRGDLASAGEEVAAQVDAAEAALGGLIGG